jgi:hypothetical protein
MVVRRAGLWVVLGGLAAGLAAGCSDDTSSTDVPREDGGADADVDADADGRDDGDAPPTEGGDGDADVDGREAFDGTCTEHEQCQDDQWCNGAERCEGGACVAGDDPCDDRIDCTVESCDEDLDRCYHTGDNSLCQDELVCNGEEQCLLTGCSAGTRPDCRDTSPCTIDNCVEDRGGCVHDLRDLDGDTFVTSDYGCDVLGGTDCNDSDALINPDADEICDDIRDNDCDTLPDFSDPECRPVNDTCAGAIALEAAVSVNSSTRGTIGDYTIPCSYSRYEDVTFSITLTERLDVIVDASARSGGTLYVDFERTCGVASSSMRCQSGTTTSLRRNGLEPGTYYVVVQGSGGIDFTISYTTAGPTPIPPNDVCSGAIDIPAAGGVVTGTLLDTTCRAARARARTRTCSTGWC